MTEEELNRILETNEKEAYNDRLKERIKIDIVLLQLCGIILVGSSGYLFNLIQVKGTDNQWAYICFCLFIIFVTFGVGGFVYEKLVRKTRNIKS